MANSHKEILQQVFCDVLENLAFMFGDILDEEASTPSGEAIQAEMCFKGPIEGKLRIAVPKEMCPTIAANVLGIEPDDETSLSDASDALKELLNVTCGHVLTSLMGDEPIFDLTVPEVTQIEEEEWADLAAQSDTAAFMVEEHPVLLHLEVEQ
jgi:chemotaxis protein CheY-P-specific phosphatase CheC